MFDYHVHTSFSDDSECPMEEMVLRGIALGLAEICFTDHIDYGVKTDDGPKERRNCLREPYFAEIERLRKRYGSQITIRAGMEFGIQRSTIPLYRQIFSEWPFDFIILSCHQVDNLEFWNQAFQRGKSQEEIHRRYYEEIYAVMQEYHDYSVLGHLDMIKRYDPYGRYPDDRVMDMIEKILTLAISEGKGIEVNTSSYRYGLPDLTPSVPILKKYRELGGRILTLGSDAHESAFLADHIHDVIPILRTLGFDQIYTFDRMEVV